MLADKAYYGASKCMQFITEKPDMEKNIRISGEIAP